MWICDKDEHCIDCTRNYPNEKCEHYIEVQVIKRGRWVWQDEIKVDQDDEYCYYTQGYVCSECGHIEGMNEPNYCSNCGAEMSNQTQKNYR